jgi:hypothetical protein
MNALIDNDILFKGACYGLLDEFISGVCVSSDPVGVLGSAWFVVSKRIQRTPLNKTAEGAINNLRTLLNRAVTLEPNEVEQGMAANFELAALRSCVSLDAGESQLCAVLISRLIPYLLTGDKRAIEAIEQLLDSEDQLAPLRGKVRCLEQLVLDVLTVHLEPNSLRASICAEAHIDKALAICFLCSSTGDRGDYAEGLRSYISDLRRQATRVLSV